MSDVVSHFAHTTMARKANKVHRVNKKDWYHPGDIKGFMLMFLALVIVVLSTLAVKALTKVQTEESQVMDILLSEMVNSDQEGLCVAEQKNLELSGGDDKSCYSQADILCTDGSNKTMVRQRCLSKEKWSVFADAFCGAIEVECK